jgi:hypothetical protein
MGVQVIAYSWEWVLSHESITKVYDKAGNCVRPEAAVDTIALSAKNPQAKVSIACLPGTRYRLAGPLIAVVVCKQLALRGPTRLEWLLHAKAREAINEAVAHAKGLCEDLDLVVDCFATKTGGCATAIDRTQMRFASS